MHKYPKRGWQFYCTLTAHSLCCVDTPKHKALSRGHLYMMVVDILWAMQGSMRCPYYRILLSKEQWKRTVTNISKLRGCNYFCIRTIPEVIYTVELDHCNKTRPAQPQFFRNVPEKSIHHAANACQCRHFMLLWIHWIWKRSSDLKYALAEGHWCIEDSGRMQYWYVGLN